MDHLAGILLIGADDASAPAMLNLLEDHGEDSTPVLEQVARFN